MNNRQGRWLASISTCLLAGSSAFGGLIGGNIQISTGSGGRFPDVAFSSADNKYFVVWIDFSSSPTKISGRFMTSSGAVSGGVLPISTNVTGYALYPAVCYNPTTNEFLATWDDGRGDVIYGQRVSSSTGLPLGANFAIGTVVGGCRSAIAWNASTNNYLVVLFNFSEVFGQLVSGLGVPVGTNFNITNDGDFSGYPSVGSDTGNQFLVTWDYSPTGSQFGYIRGQRINATTGVLIGGPISITSIGGEDRSQVTFDTLNNRWCVQHQEQLSGGNSYDQHGRLVSTTGTLVGSPIDFATSPEFEGDTQFGGDIAFIPNFGGRYLASFGTSSGMGAQETTAAGNLINGRITMGTGGFTSLSNAADPNLNRWLHAWEGQLITGSGPFHVYSQLFEATDLTPPAAPANFTATPGSGQLALNWTNPNDSDFVGTRIRYKLGSFPAHINDGTLLTDQPNTPGSNDSYVHMGLSSGVTYFYSAFAYDQHPNFSSAAQASGVPATTGDFDLDTDVDQKDFAHLQNCFSGSTIPYDVGCSDADFDSDEDVDGADFVTFDGCMRGANQPPGC